MPIYYVAWEGQFNQRYAYYMVKLLVKVWPCDISEVDEIWAKEIKPLIDMGRQINTDIYLREPENPFKDFKNE